MTRVALPDAEVSALRAGRVTRIVRAVRLPAFRVSGTPGYDWAVRGLGGRRRTELAHTRRPGGCWQDYRVADLVELCPLGAPDALVDVAEAWACLDAKARPGCRIAYRADAEKGFRARVDAPWRAAVTLPAWAVRTRYRVAAVHVIPHGIVPDAWAWEARVELLPSA